MRLYIVIINILLFGVQVHVHVTVYCWFCEKSEIIIIFKARSRCKSVYP